MHLLSTVVVVRRGYLIGEALQKVARLPSEIADYPQVKFDRGILLGGRPPKSMFTTRSPLRKSPQAHRSPPSCPNPDSYNVRKFINKPIYGDCGVEMFSH